MFEFLTGTGYVQYIYTTLIKWYAIECLIYL